ncbi:Sesquiterpene synthase TPS2 [Linum grandiflorum]
MESDDEDDIGRPTAKFHPSPWGDFFLTHLFQSDEVVKEWNEKIETLKPDVARKLLAPTTVLEKLNLVDVVQRLGMGYHFEEEIQQLLQQVYQDEDVDDFDLQTVSLRFRLLRQYGIDVLSGTVAVHLSSICLSFRLVWILL